jgi:tetratricopeptide (TPR) repeat protein
MNEKVALETKIEEWSVWIKKGFYVLLALLILGAGYLAYQRWTNDREEKAFALLFEAEKLERDLAEEPAFATPTNPQFYQKIAQWDAAKKSLYTTNLQKVLETFPQSLASNLARLRLGVLAFGEKNWEAASKHFEDAASASQPLVRFQALEAHALVLEDQGNWDAALKKYEQALAIKVDALKAMAVLGKARVLRKQGNVEESKKLLTQVIKDHPNTYFEKLARVASVVE